MVTHLTPSEPMSEGVFRAVSDGTRRAILDGLASGPRTAGDIASDFDISRPGVSKHLRLLSEVGLVTVEKSGRERRYRLNPEPLSEIDVWLTRYRLMWSAKLVGLKELAEERAREAKQNDAKGDTP